MPEHVASVTIETLGHRGDGIAGLADQRIHIPYTVPGDEVKIRYRGDRGRLEKLIAPGPDRTQPPCPYYGKCGGCSVQHITSEFYKRWKCETVTTALERVGIARSIVAPMISCPPNTRRRAQFAVRKTKGQIHLGFFERGSITLVNIDACLVLSPGLNAAIPALKALAAATPENWQKFNIMVTQCDNGLDVSLTGSDVDEDLFGAALSRLIDAARDHEFIRLSIGDLPIVVFSEPVISLSGVDITIPPGVFLQASREGEQALVDLVKPHIAKARRVADLFSGCGTFSFIADTEVHAFDIEGPAIEALDIAARRADRRHPVKAHKRNLFEQPLVPDELKDFDAVIFDPPRAGASAQAKQLASCEVPVIIGVSCNPASFARDAAKLIEGGYHLSHVTPVDQFVYAAHVELVGVFRKG
ncbi:class I SAM-dependent RNA methyltransferase [Hyphococcus sp. DH-69]|uniref:class I SAM-dependent RNA methyltransferase n=1 Tax=Hyphococcus formosus TaxID=3143534 RepID=UPI00398A6947